MKQAFDGEWKHMSQGNPIIRWSAVGAALCTGLVLSTSAHAGGFAVREQSAYYQGMSFAGNAAGDDLSSMFWNSAAAAAAPGINVASHTEIGRASCRERV
jgi:long-chain fatty acid transport protein